MQRLKSPGSVPTITVTAASGGGTAKPGRRTSDPGQLMPSDAVSRAPRRPRSVAHPPPEEVRLPLSAHGTPEQLRKLLPLGLEDHAIEAGEAGLCIRGPRAAQVQQLLSDALAVFKAVNGTDHGAIECLMKERGSLVTWAGLTIVQADGGRTRIGGEAAACVHLFKTLLRHDLLHACRLFTRLSANLQHLVLAVMPVGDSFMLALEQRGALAAEDARSSAQSSHWIALAMDDMECQALLGSMGFRFLQLARSAIGGSDTARLTAVLGHCPSAVLPQLLAEAQGFVDDALFEDLCRGAIKSRHIPRLITVLAHCPEAALPAVLKAVKNIPHLRAWTDLWPALGDALQEAELRTRSMVRGRV